MLSDPEIVPPPWPHWEKVFYGIAFLTGIIGTLYTLSC